MPTNLYLNTVDFIFSVLHVVVIMVNCFGWLSKRTLKLNLLFLVLTISSWSILGILFGVGFCFITHFHSIVLNMLFGVSVPFSFLDYMIINKLDINASSKILSLIGIVAIYLSLTLSIKKNFKYIGDLMSFLLIFTFFGWIIICKESGIGFIPELTNPLMLTTLFSSNLLIILILLKIKENNFSKKISNIQCT